MIHFVIGLRPTAEWGMNELYSQKKRRNDRMRQAEMVHLMVRAAIRQQVRPVQQFRKPVIVTIWFNSRLDVDNHGFLSKLIIDSMKGLLIEDDDRKHVAGLEQYFHDDDPNEVFVDVREKNEQGGVS